ncbi:type I methionyl aminopeptidase [Pirellulaceae bacterium]|jgi:methionyl aminopeptidase|nr:type I methionyl aminopeptidase [Pirellulaceae bacterium]MDB4794117.1 type I methionyl aminopeptidase [Pirellulaceae bacterium]
MIRNLRSLREINLMRRPGLLVWKAHQIVREMIRPGVTTGELDQAVANHFKQYDAVPLFLNYPGTVPFPAVTCISVNEEVVHGIPGNRELVAGDIVSVDTGCQIGGWCGDAAVTHAVGEISPQANQLLDVTRSVLELAIELMPVKRKWSEVAKEMQAYVNDCGFSVVEDFVGHAIGREMHEKPQVPNYYDPEKTNQHGDFDLRPGMVLAIEPMVNTGSKHVKCLDDHWTVVTRDQGLSAHFEHTIALTNDGTKVLTAQPTADEEIL